MYTHFPKLSRYVNMKLPDQGIPEIGLTGKTNALHLACRRTKGRDIVHTLLENGANPQAVDANGWDAVMIAAVRDDI